MLSTLSPILFNFYVSDLRTQTAELYGEFRGHNSINCLLHPAWRPTIVMFSRSAKVLQNILSKLESFCDFADLDANLGKTKIMIFNNCSTQILIQLFVNI